MKIRMENYYGNEFKTINSIFEKQKLIEKGWHEVKTLQSDKADAPTEGAKKINKSSKKRG